MSATSYDDLGLWDVLVWPHMTEKAALKSGENQYVFRVRNEATKLLVRDAVQKIFKVTVESVNMMNVKGKTKSFRQHKGRRLDWKKAYVTLKHGDQIEFSK